LAYPFTYLQTVAEFRNRLIQEYNCQLKTTAAKDKETGQDFNAPYMERTIDGEVLQCSFFFEDDNERPLWSVVRSICRRLRIDPSSFGITLE
jgi:hypothetical protein